MHDPQKMCMMYMILSPNISKSKGVAEMTNKTNEKGAF